VISILCYLWEGSRAFLPEYVNVLARMVDRHLPEPHRFICVTDTTQGFSSDVEVIDMPPEARALRALSSPEGKHFPSSYPRLWTFSLAAKALGERVLLLDIDCLVVSDMRRLFELQHDFVGWRSRPPQEGPIRFGGGTWMHRTGTRTHVWERFIENPPQAIQEAREAGYRGSDQAWISHCLSKTEPSWPEPSGIFCAQDYRNRPTTAPVRRRHNHRPIRKQRHQPPPGPLKVPNGAIILHMNGRLKPWQSADEIVTTHWHPYRS
jgi:hypothetical protein